MDCGGAMAWMYPPKGYAENLISHVTVLEGKALWEVFRL
jgi:hypothetical protein